MKKRITGLFVATLLALSMMAVPAMADVSTNPTTNDAWGYCIANHIHNFNGDNNGIGSARSQSKGDISNSAGNRAPDRCTSTQGDYAPIN